MYSKIHVYSVFISFPLAIIVGILYWITGGEINRPKSQAKPLRPTDSFFSVVRSSFWKIVDVIAGILWIVLDSWRKPDYEFFIRLSREECIGALQNATDDEPTVYELKKPLWGYFSGNHFSLQKWSYTPFFRDGGVRPIISGKFSFTSQGTYVRLWHRFTVCGIFFLTAWFGTALSVLSFFVASTQPQILTDAKLITLAYIIVPVFYISMLFISIQVGSFFGKVNNRDIVKFIKDVLDNHRASSQLAGFRLYRKMQGKV
jgi:hypothetical protein